MAAVSGFSHFATNTAVAPDVALAVAGFAFAGADRSGVLRWPIRVPDPLHTLFVSVFFPFGEAEAHRDGHANARVAAHWLQTIRDESLEWGVLAGPRETFKFLHVISTTGTDLCRSAWRRV